MTWPEARILADEGKLVRRRSWSATTTEFAWMFNDHGLYFSDNFTLTNGKLTGKGQRKIVTNARFTSAEFLATDWQDETDYLATDPVAPVADPKSPVVDPKPPIGDPKQPVIDPPVIKTSGYMTIVLTTTTSVDNDIVMMLNNQSIGTRVNLGRVAGRDGQKQKITYAGVVPYGNRIYIYIVTYGTEHYTSSPWRAVVTRPDGVFTYNGGVDKKRGNTGTAKAFANGAIVIQYEANDTPSLPGSAGPGGLVDETGYPRR